MAGHPPPRRPYYRYPYGEPARRIPVEEQRAAAYERARAVQEAAAHERARAVQEAAAAAQPPARPPQPPDRSGQAAALAAQVGELTATVEELTAKLGEQTTRAAELEQQVAAARAEASEQHGKAASYLDLAQRTQADFVNYKRRAERERGDEGQAARADLLGHLLPALDDLERALDHVPEEIGDNAWAAGLPLVARQLRLALARAGVERLGAEGDLFDPHLHEAVAYQPHPGFAEGQIAHVARPGYRLGERIIRPAQVVVAQDRQ